jgi:hypothetical protein
MNVGSSNSDTSSATVKAHEDSSKLVSLLALAAGALAMPQSASADIIVTDLTTNFVTVGPNGSPSFLIDNLPGTARLGFEAHERTTLIGESRLVSALQKAGYVRLKSHSSFIVPAVLGATWDQIIGTSTVNGLVGRANGYGNVPNSFLHLYIAFKFKDSTQVGSPVLYGWIDASLSNPVDGSGPDVTIFRYAFDSTGAKIPMGAVPEPAPAALLALGALTLGAKGLRSWRRNRATLDRS